MHKQNSQYHQDQSVRDARAWAQVFARYREPSLSRSLLELVVTAGPFVLLWLLAWAAVALAYWWLGLLIAIPAAGFLVRLFMIQHDCGHGNFFRHRLANDWIGRVIGVLTLTPYDYWRHMHATHHASSGDLDRRGAGDIDTLTVREYLAASPWRPTGQGAARLSRAANCRPNHADRELSLRPPGAVGRMSATAHFLPRAAPDAGRRSPRAAGVRMSRWTQMCRDLTLE
jgi:fatty acid desaturase